MWCGVTMMVVVLVLVMMMTVVLLTRRPANWYQYHDNSYQNELRPIQLYLLAETILFQWVYLTIASHHSASYKIRHKIS